MCAAESGFLTRRRIATGTIAIKRFKNGDPYSCPESELMDWVITHPDGTEEGNVVGKFLDEWQKTLLSE